jgi:hypothetical protein
LLRSPNPRSAAATTFPLSPRFDSDYAHSHCHHPPRAARS